MTSWGRYSEAVQFSRLALKPAEYRYFCGTGSEKPPAYILSSFIPLMSDSDNENAAELQCAGKVVTLESRPPKLKVVAKSRSGSGGQCPPYAPERIVVGESVMRLHWHVAA